MKTVRVYGPVAAVFVLSVAALVAIQSGGDDNGERSSGEVEVVADYETLVRSGPQTPVRAELVGETFEPGPNCDPETGRIKLPTVYAPPCVEPLDGDNGGATSQGVTGDTIKLVLYLPKEDFFLSMVTGQNVEFDPETTIQATQHFVELFNRTFETYGRQVELEVYRAEGSATSEAEAKADAIAIAEMEPFAVIGGPFVAFTSFADELAAQGIVCLPGCTGSGLPESFAIDRDPYVWLDSMTADQSGLIAGEAIGALAPPGEPAELAGDPELQEQERTYALVYAEGDQEEFLQAVRDGLAEQDAELAVEIPYSLDPNKVAEQMRTHIAKLESAGVTTVIVTGAPFTPVFLTNEATAQGYEPEWILGPNYFADTALFGAQTDQDQWQNGFGIAYKITAHTAPSIHSPGLYEWAYGDEAVEIPTSIPYLESSTRMLFTGIHLAGAELSPEAFRDGLFRFPPSGDGVTSATVSWGDHGIWPEVDYGDADDVGIMWWDPDAVSPRPDDVAPTARGPGLYRLADGGQRYALGNFPDSAEAAGLHDDGSSVVMYGAPRPDEIDQLFKRYDPPDLGR